MKQMKFVPAGWIYRLAGWLLPILSLVIFSCKKNNSDMLPKLTDLNAVANVLHGEVYSGPVEAYQEEDGIVFGLDNWKTIFVLEKLNPDPLPICGINIEHAKIIYSESGILIHNEATRETWTYANNDSKSQQKFEKINKHFANSPSQALIFGLIRINSN
jgi:hypothetical protein